MTVLSSGEGDPTMTMPTFLPQTPHMPTRVQTKSDILEVLTAGGLRPRKRFGQNFLIDGNLMRRLAESAEISGQDVVLEVGGGTGGLTDLLSASGASVVCVELDRDLGALLTRRFAGHNQVRVITTDALRGKNRLNAEVVASLRDAVRGAGGRMMLVANLPYQIATPLVMNLLLEMPEISRMCFTVQAEVGDRILAAPGSRDFGPVSVMMQVCCDVRMIARVPASAFWPAPKVESVMLRADVREEALIAPQERGALARLVRGAFEHRRKTLRSALGYVVGAERVEKLAAEFNLTRRPEDVEPAEWVRMLKVS